MSPDAVFPQRLTATRKLRGLSQVALARLVGMTQGNLSTLEHGHSLAPLPTLVRLSQALDVSTDYLLGLTDEPVQAKGWRGFVADCQALNERNLVWPMGLTRTLVYEQGHTAAMVRRAEVLSVQKQQAS